MGDGEQAVGEQAVVKPTAQIDWRKLLVLSLLVMVLPTVSAIVLDKWLGTLPLITIAAIVLCFPTATFLVIKLALQEMDRVIAEVAPSMPQEPEMVTEIVPEATAEPEATAAAIATEVFEPAPELVPNTEFGNTVEAGQVNSKTRQWDLNPHP